MGSTKWTYHKKRVFANNYLVLSDLAIRLKDGRADFQHKWAKCRANFYLYCKILIDSQKCLLATNNGSPLGRHFKCVLDLPFKMLEKLATMNAISRSDLFSISVSIASWFVIHPEESSSSSRFLNFFATPTLDKSRHYSVIWAFTPMEIFLPTGV